MYSFLFIVIVFHYQPQLRVSMQGDELNAAGKSNRDKVPGTPGSEVSFPIPNDDDVGNQGMPPPDNDDENPMNDLSFSRDGSMGGPGNAIGGLDDSADGPTPPSDNEGDDAASQKSKKRSQKVQPEGPKRRRTRRKIIIDNDMTELDGDHMKNMLRDTSDIVLQNVPYPSDWNGSDEGSLASNSQTATNDMVSLATQEIASSVGGGSTLGGSTMPTQESAETTLTQRPAPGRAQEMGMEDRLLLEHLSFEDLLARPSLGDDGQLAPALVELWRKNLSRVRGKPFPYPKRKVAGREFDVSNEEEEDVEVARVNKDESMDEEGLVENDKGQSKVKGEEGVEMEEEEFPQPDDEDDGPMPVADDGEEEQPMPTNDEEEDAQPVPFDEDEEEDALSRDSAKENKFGLSTWGLVNEAKTGEDSETEDDPRQAAGTELVSSSTKWHKHTVRVLQLLQRTMGNKGGNLDADGHEKPDRLSFDEISKNCSRRTAAGVFFEMLQLKTWDFVEVDQGEAYGDITSEFQSA